MAHAAGDAGWIAWTNGVDASVADKLDTTVANSTYARPTVVFQGIPDAVVLKDGTITTGTSVLTSASGKFLPAHVGMTITIGQGGAAGADLRTTVASYQSPTQVTLTANAGVTLTTGGVLVGSDSGPALQSALTALSTSLGGWLFVPAGKYAIWSPVVQNFNAANLPQIRISGAGTASQIFIGTGPTTTAITMQNLHIMECDSITFAGNPSTQNDATTAISMSSIWQATFRDVKFHALTNGDLSTDVPNRGVIEANTVDIKFERCNFGGSAGGMTYGNSVVRLTSCKGFSAEDTQWIDWGVLNGSTDSKIAIHGSTAWVELVSWFTPTEADASGQSAFRVTNCRMDEGAVNSIWVHPSTGRTSNVVIDGLRANVANYAGGVGVRVSAAVNVTVRDSWLGYATNVRDAINLSDISGVVTLERVITAQNAAQITASATVAVLDIIECTYTTLVSAAGVTNIRKSGAVVIKGAAGITVGQYGPVLKNRQISDLASVAVLDMGIANWPVGNPAAAATTIGLGTPGAVKIATVTAYTGAGVPAFVPNANGDIYIRSDGAAGAVIYQRRAGAWVATAA